MCEGHWQNVERQELVCAGHWENRVDRVRVADSCDTGTQFSINWFGH